MFVKIIQKWVSFNKKVKSINENDIKLVILVILIFFLSAKLTQLIYIYIFFDQSWNDIEVEHHCHVVPWAHWSCWTQMSMCQVKFLLQKPALGPVRYNPGSMTL